MVGYIISTTLGIIIGVTLTSCCVMAGKADREKEKADE